MPSPPDPCPESRRVLKRVGGSLAEIVVMESSPGYKSLRTTCPDGQFWVLVRGEQSISGDVSSTRQHPFVTAYYAPRQPAVRIAERESLAYGLRIYLSKMTSEEVNDAWYERDCLPWSVTRTALNLIARGLNDPGFLDESVACWVASRKPTPHELAMASWISRVEDLLYDKPDLTLLELSRSIGIAPSYLSGEFSRIRGVTISVLRRRIMLQRALQCSESMKLNVAAIEAGFYDASHFHRACVAELDLKPSAIKSLISPT
jgi:AraC-like DNA-binding protein